MSVRPLMLFLLALVGAVQLTGQSDRTGKDYALFFAVNEYEDDRFSDLDKPIENAHDLAEELSTRYGFQTEVVENPEYATITEKIRAYHDKFAREEFPRDGQLLIFFAGHGLEFGNAGYFASANGDAEDVSHYNLSYGYARPLIDQIPCQHIMVVVDACFSKTFDPLHGTRSNRDFGRSDDIEQDQILLHHAQYKSRLFISSDSENQESPDASALVQTWLGALRTHRTERGYLTAAELFGRYLREAVPSPGAGPFGSDDPASRFLFFPRGWTAPAAPVAPTPPSTPALTEEEAADEDLYEFAKGQNSIVAYEVYLREFPNGRHIDKARLRLEVLRGEAADNTDSGTAGTDARTATDLQLMKAKLDPETLRRINYSSIVTSAPKVSPAVNYGNFKTMLYVGPPASAYNKPAIEAADKRLRETPTSTAAKRQLADAYLTGLKGYKRKLDTTTLRTGSSSKEAAGLKKEMTTIANYALSLYKQVEMITPGSASLLSSIISTYGYLGDKNMVSVFKQRRSRVLGGAKLTSYFKK